MVKYHGEITFRGDISDVEAKEIESHLDDLSGQVAVGEGSFLVVMSIVAYSKEVSHLAGQYARSRALWAVTQSNCEAEYVELSKLEEYQ